MKQIQTQNLYDLNQTITKELLERYTYPWEVLPYIEDYIIKLGQTLPKDEYFIQEENIWIHKTAKIYPSAYIKGPCIIQKDAEIRHCAFIRGKAIIGQETIVGNSVELKNVILFNKVEVPHFNYVGDSILGYKAHLGAGAITSNIKSDRQNIIIRTDEEIIETGLRKIGAMLGDNVEIGCNTVLNPGTIIGRNTNIYPLSSVRGIVPEESIYEDKETIVKKLKLTK